VILGELEHHRGRGERDGDRDPINLDCRGSDFRALGDFALSGAGVHFEFCLTSNSSIGSRVRSVGPSPSVGHQITIVTEFNEEVVGIYRERGLATRTGHALLGTIRENATVFAVGAAHNTGISVTYLARALVLAKVRAFIAAGEGLAQGLLSIIPGAAFHTIAFATRIVAGWHAGSPSGGVFFGAGRARGVIPTAVDTSTTCVGAASRGPAAPANHADGLRAASDAVETIIAGAASGTADHFVDRAIKHTYVVTRITSFTCIGAASIDPANIAEGLRADSGLACAVGYALADRYAGFSLAATIRLTGRAGGFARACLDALGFPAAVVVDAADVFRQALFCRS